MAGGEAAPGPPRDTSRGSRKSLGDAGEETAAEWYRLNGYVLVARNWRCPLGEVDLIARKGHTCVFCEVKSRSSDAFGAPAEAVGSRKRARLRRLASAWLKTGAGGPDPLVRFDVATVLNGRLEVIEGAF